MSTLDRNAFDFFHRNAGYLVGQAAICAASLARAEQWGDDLGLELSLEPEHDPDLSWMTEDELKQDHECYSVSLSYDGKMLPFCLGNVVDPDRNYLRILRAELLSEALAAGVVFPDIF